MRLTTRPVALVGGVLAATLLLTACGGSEPVAPADSPTSAEETTDAAEPTESETEAAPEETATPEPSPTPTLLEVDYDVTAIDFGAPGAVTPPGSALTKGQAVWLNQTATYGDQEITGPVGLSVLEVRQLEPSLFDQFNNAEEFAGYTPYAVITQHQWLYDIPADHEPVTVDLFPLKEDGSDAEYLTGGMFTTMFSSPGDLCGLQLPPYDAETKTLVSCWVALSPDLPVTQVKYNGETYGTMFADADNQYFNAPVVWN